MGKVIAQIHLGKEHLFDLSALVDTGAAYLTMPTQWLDRLGGLELIRTVSVETATDQVVGEIRGPIRLRIDGFPPVMAEILFLDNFQGDMPLLGYIPLEQSQAIVDLVGHRLIHVKSVDAKAVVCFPAPIQL